MAKFSVKKSTIVRTLFGILERRAPRLGSLWAERLWCAIPRDGRPRQSPAAPGQIATLPLAVEAGAGADAKPHTFVAEVWGTTGPVVYLLHGWGGYRGQLGAFVGPLTAAGYRVVALDAPSHGDSGPGSFGARRSLITEFTAALTVVSRAFGPAHGIVAHSLGGGATALAVLDGLPADRLVLISPAPDPNMFARVFAASLGFGDRVREGLMRRLERRTGRPMSDFDAAAKARAATERRTTSGLVDADADAAALPPLLVVHDHDDKVIPYAQGRTIAQAWQGAELLSTTGLGHHRILRDPEVVRSAVDFLGHPAISAPTATADPHLATRP